MAAPGLDEKSARVRNLLSSYYGTSESRAESPASSRSTTSSTVFKAPRSLGLDSTAFDCDKYVKQLLNGTRLSQLLQKQLQISSEVKSLDSDMQMLVYENYNKFISATDTIRTMKNNVDGMDGKMQTLQKVIGSVADRSSSVNTRLHQRHQEMEDLSNIRALLVKLQAVFELPQKLRIAQQQGAIEVAAEKYAEVAELLRLYGHKGAFRRVKAEIQTVVNDLVLKVRTRMNTDESSDISENLELLRKLGESNQTLQEDYLRFAQAKLDKVLKNAENLAGQLESHEARNQEGNSPSSLSGFVISLDQQFIAELGQTAATFSQIFREEGQSRLLLVSKQVFARYLELLKQAIQNWAISQASNDAAAPDLLRPSLEEGGEYGDWGAEEMTKSLATFATDVSRLQSALPELSAQDRSAEILEKSVRFHVSHCFSQLEQEGLRHLKEALPLAERLDSPGNEISEVGPQLLQVYFSVTNLMNNGLRSILQALQLYQKESVVLRSWQDVFVDLVNGQVQHLLISFIEGCKKMGGVSGNSAKYLENQQSILLIMARIAKLLESQTVSMMLELLANIFPGQGNSGGSDQPPAFVAAEVARQLRTVSQDFLRNFIQIEANSLSKNLVAPLLQGCKKSHGTSDAISLNQAVREITHVEAKVKILMSSQVSSRGDGRPNLGALASASSSGNQSTSQIFSKHHLFETPTLSPGSIMQGILHSVLKAALEELRLQIIPQESVKTLEESLNGLKTVLARHMLGGSINLINGLVDECINTLRIRMLED